MKYTFEIEDKEKLKTVITILNALNVTIKSANKEIQEEEYPYSEEFRKSIQEGKEDIKEGRVYKVALKDLWNKEAWR